MQPAEWRRSRNVAGRPKASRASPARSDGRAASPCIANLRTFVANRPSDNSELAHLLRASPPVDQDSCEQAVRDTATKAVPSAPRYPSQAR